MFRSKKRISSTGSLQQLKSNLNSIIKKKRKIYCKTLKRSVFLSRLPAAITERHDAKRRLQCFDVALDILKNNTYFRIKTVGGEPCYEIYGKDARGKTVVVHLREETHKKDRKLFFISCFRLK